MLKAIQVSYINNGLRLLDDRIPGWADKINLDVFNIDNWSKCVLGQLFGTYIEGVERLELSVEARVGYGFLVSENFEEANLYWKESIRRRKERLKGAVPLTTNKGDFQS